MKTAYLFWRSILLKNLYLLAILFLLLFFIGALCLQKREEAVIRKPYTVISIDQLKNMLSTSHVSISPASIDLENNQLHVNIPLSFSPNLYRQMADVEHFGMKIDLPQDIYALSTLKEASIPITAQNIRYTDKHFLEVSFIVPLNRTSFTSKEFTNLMQKDLKLHLSFTNAKNKPIASFRDIETEFISKQKAERSNSFRLFKNF
ncbi:hypothetical protein [Listeria kieliensis]|uniref:hypothetical protein n=1 Tax=Listeria kieliensis TaxID=1621700 RepID=UPI0010589520|nr:hypothetical protein [Listeria kieliensis]